MTTFYSVRKLTLMRFDIELTHLGPEASNYCTISCKLHLKKPLLHREFHHTSSRVKPTEIVTIS